MDSLFSAKASSLPFSPSGAHRAGDRWDLLASISMLNAVGLRAGVREDHSNHWILVPMLISACFPVGCRLNANDPPTFDGVAVPWIGVVLCAVGGALRLAPTFVLGRRFSGLVAIEPGHTLVTSGLYGTIRHPSYLGLLVMMLGWAPAFCSIVGVVLALLMLFPVVARIRSKEALLDAHFSSEYIDDRARTYRLIPWIY